MNEATTTKNKALTAAFVNSAKDPGKYHDGKGTGLFLLVKPTGGRFWVQRVTIRKKRCELGLGSPPVVTLAEAREQALENKRLVRMSSRLDDPEAISCKARIIGMVERTSSSALLSVVSQLSGRNCMGAREP